MVESIRVGRRADLAGRSLGQIGLSEMMRHGFGGHPFGPHEAERRERREGRVGELYRQHAS